MIKLTSDLLAIRAKSIIKYDRKELAQYHSLEGSDKSYSYSSITQDQTFSIIKYLKRLCVDATQ